METVGTTLPLAPSSSPSRRPSPTAAVDARAMASGRPPLLASEPRSGLSRKPTLTPRYSLVHHSSNRCLRTDRARAELWGRA